ncbi:MAG: hypothetical protein NTW58_07865 [Actinobacteria bacterium]|nr:hypothetical protein [Actinomycetota bacterium]
MIESLPDPAQEQVVEHLREYLPDVQDEVRWNELIQKTQPNLVVAARWVGSHDDYQRFFS